jgi:hypothetical protein
MPGSMLAILLFNMVAFLLTYVALVRVRLAQETQRARLGALEESA